MTQHAIGRLANAAWEGLSESEVHGNAPYTNKSMGLALESKLAQENENAKHSKHKEHHQPHWGHGKGNKEGDVK